MKVWGIRDRDRPLALAIAHAFVLVVVVVLRIVSTQGLTAFIAVHMLGLEKRRAR